MYLDDMISFWGINTLIAIFKLFKYLQIQSDLNQLVRTIAYACEDLFYFLVVFVVVMVCFDLTGVVWFGWGSLGNDAAQWSDRL